LQHKLTAATKNDAIAEMFNISNSAKKLPVELVYQIMSEVINARETYDFLAGRSLPSWWGVLAIALRTGFTLSTRLAGARSL